MSSFWDNQHEESILEIKHKLLCTNFELESAKNEAKEQQRKNEETIKQLIQLLNTVCQERDEARDQLLKLQNRLSASTPVKNASVLLNAQNAALTPQAQNPSSLPIASDTSSFTYHDHPSSSSFVDDRHSNAISPLDVSKYSYIGESPPVISMQALSSQMSTSNSALQKQDYAKTTICSPMQGLSSEMTSFDPASITIEELTKGKPLPQKGKLLDAIIAAGPLLQMLLIAGPPLPRWKSHPPPFMPLERDPVSAIQKTTVNKNVGILNSLGSLTLHRLNSS